MKIYSTKHAKQIPLRQALKLMTEEHIDAGEYCAQTLIDALAACREMSQLLREIVKDASQCTSGCSRLVDESLIERAEELTR